MLDISHLRADDYKPCRPAVAWCRKFYDIESAWAACARPDWMIWYIWATRGLDAGEKLHAEVVKLRFYDRPDKIRELYPIPPPLPPRNQ